MQDSILSLTLIFLTLTLAIGVEQTENGCIHIITGREMENKAQHEQPLAHVCMGVDFQQVMKHLRTGFDDANDWYSLSKGEVNEEFININNMESLYDSGKLNIYKLYHTVALVRLYERLTSVADVTVKAELSTNVATIIIGRNISDCLETWVTTDSLTYATLKHNNQNDFGSVSVYESNGPDCLMKTGLVFNTTGGKACAIGESKQILHKSIGSSSWFDKIFDEIHDENKTENQKSSPSLWSVIYPIVKPIMCLTTAFPVCLIYSCFKDMSALRDMEESIDGLSRELARKRIRVGG